MNNDYQLPEEIEQLFRQRSGALGSQPGTLAAKLSKIRELMAELLAATYDQASFEKQKRALKAKLNSSRLEPEARPVLIHGLHQRKLGELRKIEANLERFCAHLEEGP